MEQLLFTCWRRRRGGGEEGEEGGRGMGKEKVMKRVGEGEHGVHVTRANIGHLCISKIQISNF